MKIFTLTNGSATHLFNSLEDVLKKLDALSLKYKDRYSICGRPYDTDPETGEIINLPWMIDSALFALNDGTYITYYIECFDRETLQKTDFEK
jgi:hypothetical protein